MENSEPKFDQFDNMSSEGYEQDDSRMAEEQSISSYERKEVNNKRGGEQDMLPIARKRKKVAKELTDSGYEQDVSSNMAGTGNGPVNKIQGKFDREEETQVLPYCLGSYVDHSLDPDDDRPFAPIHRKANFPESLFAILANPNLSRIIKWLPHGRSFFIMDRDEFANKVLPVYFRHNKLSSFNRQLNGYGFHKVKIGPRQKSHYHPLFLRNLPHLVKNIKRCSKETSSDEQSILNESQLERVSTERPLPKKMTPEYESHIKEMNKVVYEGFGLQELRARSQAPASSAVPAFAATHEASFHPVPSFIYTPSPNPLPPVIYTPPPNQQPQSSPLSGSAQQNFGVAPSACQQGVVFTQTHPALAGLIPNPAALQNLFFPVPFQQQPPTIQAPSNVPMSASVAVSQDGAAQAGAAPQNSIAQGHTQFNQAQAVALANNEARRQAQVQLLANALSAAIGHQGLAAAQQATSQQATSQQAMSPSLNASQSIMNTNAANPAQIGSNIQFGNLQQQGQQHPQQNTMPHVNTIAANVGQIGSNLQGSQWQQQQQQQQFIYPGSGHGQVQNIASQQGQNAQPNAQQLSILGTRLALNPNSNTSPAMQGISNSQLNHMQHFGSNPPNCDNKGFNTDGQQTREM